MKDITHVPLIGLSVYNDKDKYHYYPQDYIRAVRNAGGIPILLPPQELNVSRTLDKLDGIILTGGGDINPDRYGGESHSSVYWVNDIQDESEYKLASLALSIQKPILATCRGMQIINVLLGGTLHPHVPDVYGEMILHRHLENRSTDHQVDLLGNSRLLEMLDVNQFSVKSWHHQSIDKLADGFRAVGFAPDGVIEAIESDVYPNLISVQWHPEISADEDAIQQKLFDQWVSFCMQKVFEQ